MRTGAGHCVITNELGTDIQGATVGGVAEHIRDELEANALYFEDGDSSVLLVSCDFGGLEPEPTARARQAIAEATGVPEASVIIGATHTGGPSVIPSNYLKPIDTAYLDRLHGWLVALARETIESAVPATVAAGLGKARIGYNRRCCWADGSHSMHGKTDRADFTGMEGAEDDDHTALVARGPDGNVIGVLHINTAHPCSFYGASFYSADFPGTARSYLREVLGDIPVLFFNGAFGDIGTICQLSSNGIPQGGEKQMLRVAHQVAGETLRLLHETEFRESAPLAHAMEELELPVRLPSEEVLRRAEETLARVDAGEKIPPFEIVFAHGSALLQRTFGEHPVDTLRVHAVRVGDFALVTQPTELFCQFGLDIKRRSPYPHTAVCSICDEYHGYCPTTEAIIGGGYSAKPIYWTRLCSDAGYRIVDCACRLLAQL